MRLLTPSRSVEGFTILLDNPAETPEITFDGNVWIPDTQWMRVTDSLRDHMLTLLWDSRDKLFKNPPSKKMLENIFAPLTVIDTSGNLAVHTNLPLPSDLKEGKGVFELKGIQILKSSIEALWHLKAYVVNTPVVDIDWGESKSQAAENEIREITLIEQEVPSEDNDDTLKLNTDEEYNARKFAAKERVKEARLKAILARRAAEVETQRYFEEFNINDSESTFSEYDISDFSGDEGEGEEEDK